MIYEVEITRFMSERATIKVDAVSEEDAEDMVTRLMGMGQLEGEDWVPVEMWEDQEEVDLVITPSYGEPDFVREDIVLE